MLMLIAFALPTVAWGQTTIYEEPFNYSDGTTAPGDGSWSLDEGALNPEVFSVQSDSLRLVDAADGGTGGVEFKTETIDVSSFATVDFSLDLAEDGDLEGDDFVDVAYSTDGGTTFTEVGDWNGNGSSSHTLTGNWKRTTVTQSGLSGSQLVLRVTMRNNSGSEELLLDDVTVTSRPTVEFTTNGGTVGEGAGTTILAVKVLDPPSGTSVSAEVAFKSGSSSAASGDVGSFGTKSVTFPSDPSSGDTETVAVDLAAGDGGEGEESAVFALQNVSGGGAATSSPAQFDLTIRDPVAAHGGDVLITEIMPNPSAVADGAGEYIELYNSTSQAIDLGAKGWTLDVGGTTAGTPDGDTDKLPTTIPARGFAVLCVNAAASENGDLETCDVDYVNGISLTNGGSTIELLDGSDNQVDIVDYGRANYPPVPDGASLVFTGTTENNDGTNWAAATRRERGFGLNGSEADGGSPGRNGDKQHLQPTAEVTGAAGWRMLSAPMGGVNADTLARVTLVQGLSGHFSGADPNLYRWPGGTDADVDWTVPASATTDLTGDGGGFIWYVFGAAETDATDVPPFTLSVPGNSRTSDVITSSLGKGFHLLGNPYAQSLDLSEVPLGGRGFQTTVQVWESSTDSYEAVSQSESADDLIAPYQAFFVERASGSNTLTIRASGRRAHPVSLKAAGEGVPRIGFRLAGRKDDGSVLTRDDALALRAPKGATAGWDVHDASKLTPLSGRYATAAFRSSRGGETRLQAVASIPPSLPSDGLELPLSLQLQGTDAVDTFVLSWPTWKQVPDHWGIALHDTVADSTLRLRNHESYAFTLAEAKAQSVPPPRSPLEPPKQIRSKAQSDEARFEIRLQPGPIPVEFTGIEAVRAGDRVRLTWTTASETSNAGFRVEHRGPDGGPFGTLGFVEGHGTTNKTHRYHFRTDPLDPGRHLFRLRQVDLDGTTSRSDTVAVQVGLDTPVNVQVFPNPVADRATVALRVRTEQPVSVVLYDVLGRRVRTLHEGTVSVGRTHTFPLRTGRLSSGLYLLRVVGKHFRKTRRVTVVR